MDTCMLKNCLCDLCILLLMLELVLIFGVVSASRQASVQRYSNEISNTIGEALYFEVTQPEEVKYTFKIRPARDFGGVFKRTLFHQKLVLANPMHGCSLPENARQLAGAIALMQRGDCSFLSKVMTAMDAGAIGVIIADADHMNEKITFDMVGDGTGREPTIPAFCLSGKDGYMIKQSLQRHNFAAAVINIPVNITGIPPHEIRHPPWILW